MNLEKTSNGLTVALCLSDIKDVKEITTVFKKLNIVPHYYEDLKTFYQETINTVPSLCIVDVLKMSEGELSLSTHPHVLTEKLPIVFTYSDRTEPLLVSTFDFYHLGLIKKGTSFEKALAPILKRLNHIMFLEGQNIKLKETLSSLENRCGLLESEVKLTGEIDQYQSMVRRVCSELEDKKNENDFFKAVSKVFNQVEEIREYAFLELSFNGQKLLSPLIHEEKYRVIPSIWLPQLCKEGIEYFAQNMASQVALEVIGGDLVTLFIKGDHQNPDKIIFIKTKDEIFFDNFDWTMLEAYLNGYYSSFRVKIEKEISPSIKIQSNFEAMELLDQYLFVKTSEDIKLLTLDLTDLIQLILSKKMNRFFWVRFEKEFINKLQIQSRAEFKYFNCGVSCFGFIVNPNNLEIFFDDLKAFAQKFSYWKYFENSEDTLSKIVNVKVKMLPLSSYSFLNYFHNVQYNENIQTELNFKSTHPKRQITLEL